MTRPFATTSKRKLLVAVTNHPVCVTLVWADAPGSPVGEPWVNDLDLEVSISVKEEAMKIQPQLMYETATFVLVLLLAYAVCPLAIANRAAATVARDVTPM